MSQKGTRKERKMEGRRTDPTDRRPSWEGAGSRSASEVLAILEPAREEPRSILTMGFWKSGGADDSGLQAVVS